MILRHPASAFRFGAVPVLALLLAGCASDRLSFPGTGPAQPPAPTEPAVAPPKPPPISMAGRWVMRSGGTQCNMNFGQASPDAADGTVAPGGGCPGNFFTTRRWSFDRDGLLLSNHNNQPMARLSIQGDSFSGSAVAGGAPVSLSR